MKNLGIFGYGKMGKSIETIASSISNISSVKVHLNGDDIHSFIKDVDFITDFSTKEATESLVDSLLKSRELPKALLIGTTGLTSETSKKIKELSSKIAVMHAPNTSLGANLQSAIAKKLATILGNDYDIDIIDIHHNQKVDSPSGTAYMLANSINNGLEESGLEKHTIITDRSSNPKRLDNEIAISSIRAGNVIGQHDVIFHGQYESLSLSHKVDNREVFAQGAVKAALWLLAQQNGLYKMNDMLDL